MHRPGIEPGPPTWQASILPLNHRCLQFVHILRKQEETYEIYYYYLAFHNPYPMPS